MPPRFKFDTDEALARIDRLAHARRDNAILTLTTSPPRWTEQEAEDQNPLERHQKGVAAEFAVARWLEDNNVKFTPNFEDVQADFAGEPDILVEDPRSRCDVKATYFSYPERQRGSLDRKDVIIWCYSHQEVVLSIKELRAKIVAYEVTITGWTESGVIKEIKPGGGWIDVPREDVKEPGGLLTRFGR